MLLAQETMTVTVPKSTESEKYAHLVAALKRRSKDRVGLVDSRYFRWITGDMPDVIRVLVENRDLATALLEDAIRYEMARPTPAAEDDGTT